ncbi:MAG: hypothetical protein JXA04_00105 [Gammaproteobacteria bacterium]|nr:hypothetical protein [Gammaproteobacteria bacterium]
MAFRPDLEKIISVMSDKGYVVFKDARGHDLNIVGIRTQDNTANRFNDWISVFYWFDKQWTFFAFPGTTDPGTFYRQNPLSVSGTAIMKPGQYRRAYKIGRHRGYKALQQAGSIAVFRDTNRDAVIDTTGVKEETGINAINIHKSNAHRASTLVGKWSAGCQVFQDPDHFGFFLTLCERAKEKYGNIFSYTLLEELDF